MFRNTHLVRDSEGYVVDPDHWNRELAVQLVADL